MTDATPYAIKGRAGTPEPCVHASVLNGGGRQRPQESGSARVVSALRPTELLDRYTAGCFFFASPTQTLLAEGCARLVCAQAQVDPSALPGLVAEALAEDNGATVVVGAVPFSSTGETRLVIPERVLSGARLESDIPLPEEVRRGDEQGVELLPEPDEYMRGVESALSELKRGQLRKVVLARTIEFKTSVSLDVRQLLRNLAWRDPGAYTFAVDLGEPRESIGRCRTIVGASPELLVSRAGTTVVANPLAGSAARSPDPSIDRERAVSVLASSKNRREHELVVEHVVNALRPLCACLELPSAPSLVRTAAMWHLSTRIVGRLAEPAVSSLALAMAMHPTPAVCGVPVDAARKAIGRIEPFDRGLYGGIVGWCDATGDGEWAVTIRCGEIDRHSIRLFTGAGIVEGSDPLEELRETSAKCRTLLAALGVPYEL